MKRNPFLSAGLLLVATLAAACGWLAPVAGSRSEPISNYVSLVGALRAQGAPVEPNGDVSQPFLSIKGQLVRVNGQDIQVFEYADGSAVTAEAHLVSPDGNSVGTTRVSWADSPHFYQADRLIVLYVGDNAARMDLLKAVLGPQFAGA